MSFIRQAMNLKSFWNFSIRMNSCKFSLKVLTVAIPWRLQPKQFQTSVAVPPVPVQVPSQRPLAPSVVLVTSVTNKDDNEIILGAVHRSGICLTAEENLS
jgi:hypothetical protein